MSNGLEQRISRLEKRIAERAEKNKVCNCRVTTSFHSADCLDAVLKGMSRVCSLHGFRELGFFFWTASRYPIHSEDNQFCPCPPDPWRSFRLSKGPHTWEGHDAAKAAERKLQPDRTFNLQENNRRLEAIMEEYEAARQQWVEKSGRQLPSKQELVKLEWKRARKHVDQEPRASV